VGERYIPGSGGRRDGGQPGDLEALDQYGIGEKDPATGIYPSYDVPKGHAAEATVEDGTPITWDAIAGQWPLIVADFSSAYGIRLVGASMRWPEFAWHIHGLLQTESRLSRFFAPPEPSPTDAEGD
jgi:hypothetical protein